MSSSRSVAAARARRSNDSAQYPPRPTGPGHSIQSSGNFAPQSQSNNGNRQPPAAVQTKQPSYVPPQARAPPPNQSAFDSHSSSYAQPPYPSKVSVQDAIGVLSTRIARLESFMHNYNLETPGSTNGFQQPTNGGQMDDSLLRNIMTRLDSLEKEKRSGSSTSVPIAPIVTTNHSSEIQQMNQELNQVKEELKDTSKMLTSLQSFTMETNQKLVNLLFQDTNEMQVDSYSETMFDNGDCIALDTTEINDIHELEEHNLDGQFASGSLKDTINAELSKLAL